MNPACIDTLKINMAPTQWRHHIIWKRVWWFLPCMYTHVLGWIPRLGRVIYRVDHIVYTPINTICIFLYRTKASGWCFCTTTTSNARSFYVSMCRNQRGCNFWSHVCTTKTHIWQMFSKNHLGILYLYIYIYTYSFRARYRPPWKNNSGSCDNAHAERCNTLYFCCLELQ